MHVRSCLSGLTPQELPLVRCEVLKANIHDQGKRGDIFSVVEKAAQNNASEDELEALIFHRMCTLFSMTF
jgi:hypothetical protein